MCSGPVVYLGGDAVNCHITAKVFLSFAFVLFAAAEMKLLLEVHFYFEE